MPPPNRQWTPVPERVDNYRELKQLQRRQHFEFQRQVLDAYKGICSSIGISRNERRQQQQQQQEQQEQESPKIIFVRGEPKKLRAGQIAIIISEELHLKYRTGIYLCGLLYVLICCACWFNVSIFGITFYNVLRVPYYVWYIIGIFVTVILHCCPRTQDIFPFNLMLIILYLALEILFSAYIMHMVSWKHILICMAITIVVMTVGYFIGARFSNRLPSERWLYCIGFVLMFPVLLTFILALYFRNPIFWLAFGIFFFMYIGTLIPYHGRIIHLRGNDDSMPSLSVTAILILSDFVECVVPFLIYYMYYRYTKTGEWYMNSII